MSDPVVPVTPPVTVPPPQTSRGTIVELPPNLPPVAQGDSLSGVVATRAASGQVAVDTEAGQLILQTSIALAENSVVTLQIQTAGPQPQVIIVQELAGSGLGGEATATALGSEPPVTTNITLGGLVSAAVGGNLANLSVTAIPSGLAGATAGATQNAAAITSINAGAVNPASGQPAIPEGTILTLRILEVVPANAAAAGTAAQGSSARGAANIVSGSPGAASTGRAPEQGVATTSTLQQQANSGRQNAIRPTAGETGQLRGNTPNASPANSQGAVVGATVLARIIHAWRPI